MIEHLRTDKCKLTAELNESNDQAMKAIELKELAEEEAVRLTSIIQAAEVDKQTLQQQVQNLTGMVEYFRNTTVQSVDKFIKRLKLDLNLFTGGQYIGGRVPLDAARYSLDKIGSCIS